MIGTETRITSKLYKATVKKGQQLREKFEKVGEVLTPDAQNPDAPCEGNEKTIVQIPQAVKAVYPNEPDFHRDSFERDLREVLETFVAYRTDIGYFDGLNYVAAMLLQFEDEESVFTSMVNLFLQYIVDCGGPQEQGEVRGVLLRLQEGDGGGGADVAAHFEEKEVDLKVLLKEW